MAGSTVMLKALYGAVNGTDMKNAVGREGGHATPLDESGLSEAASGMARQANHMAKGMGVKERN